MTGILNAFFFITMFNKKFLNRACFQGPIMRESRGKWNIFHFPRWVIARKSNIFEMKTIARWKISSFHIVNREIFHTRWNHARKKVRERCQTHCSVFFVPIKKVLKFAVALFSIVRAKGKSHCTFHLSPKERNISNKQSSTRTSDLVVIPAHSHITFWMIWYVKRWKIRTFFHFLLFSALFGLVSCCCSSRFSVDDAGEQHTLSSSRPDGWEKIEKTFCNKSVHRFQPSAIDVHKTEQ